MWSKSGVCLAAGLWGAYGCANAAPKVAQSTPGPSPHVELSGVRLSDGAGAAKAWELAASRVVYRTSPHEADLSTVRASFYEGGSLVSAATAPAATLREDAHRLALQGGIHLEAPPEHAGFDAKGVSWHPKEGQLVADGPVRFWRPGSRLEAASLSADRGLTHVSLGGGVHGRFALPLAGAFHAGSRSAILKPARGAHS